MLTITLLLVVWNSQAQDKYNSISAFGGLGFNFVPDKIFTLNQHIKYLNLNFSDSSIRTDSYTMHDRTGGRAPRFGITLGRRISKNIPGLNLHLSIAKQANSTFQFERVYKEVAEAYMTLFVQNNIKEVYTTDALYINPAISFQIETLIMAPYMKLGVLLMFSSIKRQINEYIETNLPGYYPTFSTLYLYEYKSGPSLGVDFALGAQYPIGANLFLFGEMDMQFIRKGINRVTLVEYSENGQDKLGTLPVSRKEYEFLEEFTVTGQNPDVPTKRSKEFYSFNAMAFQIGIKFRY